MQVFHGGSSSVRVPEIRRGLYHKDFGQGFYCTEYRTQAERWAKRFNTSIVSIYEYMPKNKMNIRVFDEMTDEWLDFIVDCRSGKLHSYDIVVGAMANDQVWNYVADLVSGVLTREQFWVLAKFKHPTHQIAFCSSEALGCICFLDSYEVK